MIYLAVLLTGFGGLLVELVLVRRFALLAGNTSEASSLVIGAYLLGLGVGGLLVPRVLARRRSPLRSAAALYGVVAVAWLGLERGLAALPPLPPGAVLPVLALAAGLPTIAMGMAFPLVFAALPEGARRWQVGGLVACNLLGSLGATAVGANYLVPELGMRATSAGAAGAYLLAAALLLLPRAGAARPPADAPRATPTGRPADAPRATPTGRPADAPTRAVGLRPGALEAAAAVSGVLLVGLQLLLLRRLPFFLEGFQPTLSAVLAACLLGLTLGATPGAPLLARLLGRRALEGALLLAVLSLALGLQEHVAVPLRRLPASSELAMHARLWLCAAVAAGLPCLFLGAVIPLCIARSDDPEGRSTLAGRLFFWQGVGSVGGSLLVGHALPALFPVAFFAVAVPALACVALLFLAPRLPWPATALAALFVAGAASLGWSGAGSPLHPEPPLARGRAPDAALRFVSHRTDDTLTASVAYDRTSHSMVLYTNEFRAAETGPFADYMQVLGHLPFLLRSGLHRAAVIAFGTGTTAEAVTLWPDAREIHLVEISDAVLELAPRFAGEGPAAPPRTPDFLLDPRSRVHRDDGRRFLARCAEGALDLVTMEPLLPYSPGTASLYTREFYALADRALSERGVLVQWVPTHAVPLRHYRSLLATFARAFPHHSVWFLDGATILVGSRRPHLPDAAHLAARFEAAPAAAHLSMHEARLARPVDVESAFVGDDLLAVVGDAEELTDDRPFVERVGAWKYDGSQVRFYRANFGVLERLAEGTSSAPFESDRARRLRVHRLRGYRGLRDATRPPAPLRGAHRAARELARARAVAPESVVLFLEETLALRFRSQLEVTQRGGEGAAAEARRVVARDPGSAFHEAALALPGPDGRPALAPAEAAARATAIRPLFFATAPPFLQPLAGAAPARSPLEELGELPAPRELAALTAGDDPLAVALRAAYRVRVAHAWLEVLGQRPLADAEARRLRPLLDPALLDAAARAVAARGGSVSEELVILRRDDLPPVGP